MAYHKSHRIPDSQQVISTDGVEHLLGCRVEAVDAEGRSLLLAKENRHVTVQGRWMETWVKHGQLRWGDSGHNFTKDFRYLKWRVY